MKGWSTSITSSIIKRKIIKSNIIATIMFTGFILVAVLYIIGLKTRFSSVTNIHVSSVPNMIKIEWGGVKQGRPTNVIIEVDDGEKIVETKHLLGKNIFMYIDGEVGKKYQVTLKDLLSDVKYSYDRLFLSSESLPDLPTFTINTDDYNDPQYEIVLNPEGEITTTITNNKYKEGQFCYEGGLVSCSGSIIIRNRGNASTVLNVKKSYMIKTKEDNDFLGIGADFAAKRWLLLNVGSTLKNYIGQYVGKLCGIELQPRMRFVNLFLNGDYKGLYLLCQPVSQVTFNDIVESDGYIIENDIYWWETANFKTYRNLFGYTLKWPEIEAENDLRYLLIKQRIQRIEDILSAVDDTAEQYIDYHSFAACMLAKDILGVTDEFGSNVYFFIESLANPIIHMGPIWDLDWTADTLRTWSPSHNSEICWTCYLWKYSDFVKEYLSIWNSIKDDLREQIYGYLNQLDYAELDKGRQLEAERWGYGNPNIVGIPLLASEEAEKLKAFFDIRIDWINYKIDTIPGEEESTIVSNGCYRIFRDYDENSNLIRESYFDNSENLINKTDIFYAYREMSYNTERLRTAEWYYDKDDNPVINSSGYAGFTREYDEAGNIIKEAYFDTTQKPITIPSGYSSLSREYDDNRNVSSEVYYTLDEKRTIIGSGYAEIRREYDEKKRITLETYWDEEGKPCNSLDGYHGFSRVYNDAGDIIFEKYLDIDDNETICKAGYSCISRDYDRYRNLIKESYFAFDESTTNTNTGYASISHKYNEWNNVIEESYYDIDGKSTKCTSGYASVHYEYDKFLRLIKESYYDEDSIPIMIPAGYASIERDYDKRNRIICESYHDVDGRLITIPAGYASLSREYDIFSNVVKECYFDEEGKSIAYSLGYDYLEREYNEYNQLIKESYFLNDQPTKRNDSYVSSFTRKYDDHANIIEEAYYDEDGNLTLQSGGYAIIKKDYDDLRRMIREEYFGTKSEPILKDGIHAVEYGYDHVGNQIELRYYDLDGEPVLTTSGYASLKRSYDDQRRVVHEAYYGTDDEPVALGDGVHAIEREYDKNGVLLKEIHYDVEIKEIG